MLERLRAGLRGRRDLEQRVRALEAVLRWETVEEARTEVDRLVHEAVSLNDSVVLRRLDAVAQDVDLLREQVDDGLRGGRQHTEAALEVAERKLTRRMDILRRAAESAPAAAPATSSREPAGGPTQEPPAIEPALYVALEDRFRGEQSMIEERQRGYLPYLRDLVDGEHPVLDIGSGRGEWLRILADAEVPAVGVDTNAVLAAECRERGLRVVDADAAEHLAGLPDGSLGAVTMFQVVEHLPFPALVQTFRSVARVLRPGGVLIAETPNALNLRVAATNFWIDPTHQRPLHPEVLVFLALECGFAEVERLFLNPLGDEATGFDALPEAAAALLRRLAHDVDGPGDFTLVAWTPSES